MADLGQATAVDHSGRYAKPRRAQPDAGAHGVPPVRRWTRQDDGGREGRVTIQTATRPSSAAVTAWAHSGHSRTDTSHAKPAEIATSAVPFAHGGITRWSSQARINEPKRRWWRNHRRHRGELRPNAQAASSRNGVVGNRGSTSPRQPDPTHVHPIARNSQRLDLPPGTFVMGTALASKCRSIGGPVGPSQSGRAAPWKDGAL